MMNSTLINPKSNFKDNSAEEKNLHAVLNRLAINEMIMSSASKSISNPTSKKEKLKREKSQIEKTKMEWPKKKVSAEVIEEVSIEKIHFVEEKMTPQEDPGFAGQMEQLFAGQNFKTLFKIDSKKWEEDSTSLDFEYSLYEYILNRLKEGKLISNISEVKINISANQSIISNEIEFQLKTEGLKWTSIYARYIGSTILKRIVGYSGKIDCYQKQNVTLKTESCVFIFSHRALDVFSKNEISERGERRSREKFNYMDREI